MEFKELIELRENYLTQEFQNYPCRKTLINQYIIGGRIYFNNSHLTFEELEQLFFQELENITNKVVTKKSLSKRLQKQDKNN